MSRGQRIPTGHSAVPAPAVVVGLDCVAGLQTARILAHHAVPVVGVVAQRGHWAARTRICAQIVEAPWTGSRLLEALEEVAGCWPGQAVLFPCTDASVAFLSENRSVLPQRHVLPLAAHATVDLLMDKAAFAAHASATGLPIPRTVPIRTRDQAWAAAGAFDFPCLIKPAAKTPTWLEATTAKAIPVRDAEEFMSVYDTVAGWAPTLLAQQWVSGSETDLYSCNAYFDEHGRPLATFVARKIRQWPPDIGTSSSGEECRNDEALATAVRLFGELDYQGLAYLEMKRDSRTGRLLIIEPNVGRPTGRSAIAEAGGVELLYTTYCHALGLPLPAARQQSYGAAKWLDLRRDAQAVAVAARTGEVSLLQWLGWLRGPKAHAIWSAQDPLPFASDLIQASGKAMRALIARWRGKPVNRILVGRRRRTPAAATTGAEAA